MALLKNSVVASLIVHRGEFLQYRIVVFSTRPNDEHSKFISSSSFQPDSPGLNLQRKEHIEKHDSGSEKEGAFKS
jgi:hypothetical protein